MAIESVSDITRAGGSAFVGLTLEEVQDAVAAMLVAGSNLTLTYNDAAGTLTLATTTPKITVGTTAPGSPEIGDLWVDTN